MSPIVFDLLITGVSIMLLYLVGRYIPPLGSAMGFAFMLVGIPWVMGERAVNIGQAWCASVYTKWVTSQSVAGTSVGLVLLSRVVYFALSVMFLLGETCNTMIALPPLLHIPYTTWPDVFVIASAALFLAVPATFGAVFLEMVGAIPTPERLFPSLHWLLRVLLAVYTFALFVLSCLVIYYFFRFRGVYADAAARNALSPLAIAQMSVLVIEGLGVLVAGAAPILLRALVVGGETVGLLLVGLCSLLLGFVAFLLSVVARFAETISVAISRGRYSPYDAFTTPVSQNRDVLTNPSVDAIVPLRIEDEETRMIDMQRASVVFGGSFGSQAYSPFTKRFTAPRVKGSVFTSALLDLAGDPGSISVVHGDISPTYKDRHILLENMEKEQAYEHLFTHIGKKQVEMHMPCKATPACFVYVLDCRVIAHAVATLRYVHLHLPHHTLVVCTAVSQSDLEDATVVANLDTLRELYTEGIVAPTIVIDPASPFVRAGNHGEKTQLEFVAHAIIGLVTAHQGSTDGWTNKTALQALSELPQHCPFVSFSFASDAVAVGPVPRQWAWLRWFTKKAGVGDLGHARKQAVSLTQRVVSASASDTQAMSIPVPMHSRALLICHVPFPVGPTFSSFSREYHRQLGDIAAYCSVLTVSGNGTPYPEALHTPFILQVSCLYPLGTQAFPQQQPIIDTPKTMSLPLPTPVPSEQHGDADASSPLTPLPVEAAHEDIHAMNGASSIRGKRGRRKKDDVPPQEEQEG